ncbi:MAG: hypothetical protein AAF213_09665 [Pseudomonadota bacterium]
MDPTYIHIIHAILLMALVLPGAWAASKGHRLQYAVWWLAIFTAISWGYQVFAPEEGTRFDRMVDERQRYYNRTPSGQESAQPNADAETRDARPDTGDGILTPSDRGDNI